MGLGLALALVSGALNRVMIVELDLPASLVGLFFAMTLIVAPARIWLGHLSDSAPIRGKRREPYIALGAALLALSVIAVTVIVTYARSSWIALVGGGLLAFLTYALGLNLASNSFEALLADTFHGAARPRAVTLYKVAMLAGIMAGALGVSRLLEPFDRERFIVVISAVMAVFVILAILGTIRQEPRISAPTNRRADALPFRAALRDIIGADPRAQRFMALVALSTLGTLAQDVLLEPYGALALDMSVAETTRLTAIWGAGMLLTLVPAGLWWIGRWGYLAVLRGGLALSVIVFVGLIAAGWLGSAGLFMALVFALGLGAGLAMAGLLTAVIEFTTAQRAGLLMGVWGMAAEFGQAAGGLLGGVVVDVLRAVTGDALIAYGAVFAAEAVLLGIVLALSGSLRINQSAAAYQGARLSAEDLASLHP